MRKHYDFDKMKLHSNPYAKMLKRQVTIRIANEVVSYFKRMGNEMGVPYQSLINLYLQDCMKTHRKVKWAA